jgi:photosystem II stability/assembly factor-like uncharacterized protein
LSIARDGTVWASGVRGTFLRSPDTGRTWIVDSIAGAAALDFRSLHSFDSGRAVVASAGEAERGLAKIFTTADRGRHWTLRLASETKGVFLDAVAFWDERHGIALSDPADSMLYVLETRDAGRSWSRIVSNGLPRMLAGEAAFAASNGSIAVADSSDAWIGTGGGGRARVFHTTDGGTTWSVVETPVHAAGPASGIFALAFYDARHGVAVGGDYTKPALTAVSVALTSDGGQSWTPAQQPPAAYLSSVAYASATQIVAVGLAGTFVSNDGGWTWKQIDVVPLNSVRFDGHRGVAVGPHGRVAYTTGIAP